MCCSKSRARVRKSITSIREVRNEFLSKFDTMTLRHAVPARFVVAGVAAWIYQLDQRPWRDRYEQRRVVGPVYYLLHVLRGSVGGWPYCGQRRRACSISPSIKKWRCLRLSALPCAFASPVCSCLSIWAAFSVCGALSLAPNPTSVLLWDMVVITCYLIINVVYLVLHVLEEAWRRA